MLSDNSMVAVALIALFTLTESVIEVVSPFLAVFQPSSSFKSLLNSPDLQI